MPEYVGEIVSLGGFHIGRLRLPIYIKRLATRLFVSLEALQMYCMMQASAPTVYRRYDI